MAAHLAYLHFRPKIEKVLKKIQREEFVEEIIEKVIRGAQTAKTVREAFEERKEEVKRRERKRDDRELVLLRKRVGELLREKRELERRLRERERRRVSTGGELVTELEGVIQKLKLEKERLLEEMRELERELTAERRKRERAEKLLEKIRGAVEEGKLVGSPELIEGELLAPGIAAGELRKSPEEKIREMIEKYREGRRKELNLL
ncbi:MAG: hypothetical protein GXO00_01315 [Candidatus Diapherotrites archaeon]|nr:hypothetical protein [Candidatus Diapherotrites archaeon]